MVSRKTVQEATARANKVLSLHIHKNKIESKRKRELASSLRCQVEAMVKERDIRAYAIVGIAADGHAYALWDTGSILPLWAFADTVSNVLRVDINGSDVSDDWSPALTVKASDE